MSEIEEDGSSADACDGSSADGSRDYGNGSSAYDDGSSADGSSDDAGNNTFDDGLILLYIRDAIMCLNECNRVLDLSYQCPVQYSGGAGRRKLAVTKNQLEYLIDNDFIAKDIASMLNITVRAVHRRFQEFELSIQASYSFISDSDLDTVQISILLGIAECMENVAGEK
ncbi:Hypothetical predicted protein [Paramuricea clavata]|uniref:Uncharacterized protein n=1 Tax=Paramuricea clavata TaxID=317549 RepID=A0A6S7LTK6_PARCT|nr:Hypothetical predicted protein [Paramuricea clavata]